MFTVIVEIVLNLVISGIPSIHIQSMYSDIDLDGFKPCYKRNTFNTRISLQIDR